MLTVITPVYNAEHYLAQTIESILSQTYRDFEYILVDDGSTDLSLEIIRYYSTLDERIIYYSLPNSGNPKIPRDYAFDHSKGDFIIWIDSDDFVSPDLLEKAFNNIIRYNADMSACVCKRIDERGNEKDFLPEKDFNLSRIYNGKKLFSLIIFRPQIHMCGTLMRRSVLEERFQSDKLYIISDELDFRVHLLEAKKIVYSDAIYYYRINSQSITRASIRLFEVIEANTEWGKYMKNRYRYEDDLNRKWNIKRFNEVINYMALYWQIIESCDQKEGERLNNLLAQVYRSIEKKNIRSSLSLKFRILSYFNYTQSMRMIQFYFNVLKRFIKKIKR